MAGDNKNRSAGEGENLLDKFQARPTFLNLPEEKKDRIIARATREFSEKGYQGASINTLVDDLGISKGSIFQYFTSKKGLFLFVFQMAVDRVRRTLVGVKEETEDLEVFERIRRSILTGVDFVRRHPQIYRIYLKLLFDREAPYRAELLKAIRLFSAEYLGSLVEKGLERAEIRRDIPLEQAVFILDADRLPDPDCCRPAPDQEAHGGSDYPLAARPFLQWTVAANREALPALEALTNQKNFNFFWLALFN